jgi:hypothetical protein
MAHPRTHRDVAGIIDFLTVKTALTGAFVHQRRSRRFSVAVSCCLRWSGKKKNAQKTFQGLSGSFSQPKLITVLPEL